MPNGRSSVKVAAQAWDQPDEPLEVTRSRIHDGATDEQALIARADGLLASFFSLFPYVTIPKLFSALEIGGGLGYIMEALNRWAARTGNPPKEIIGLDIAPSMIAKAKMRLAGRSTLDFMHYDGIHVPIQDSMLDFVYSVSCLQHIPKPFAFNLMLEMKRILRPSGFAVFHVLGVKHIKNSVTRWSDEIRNQIEGNPTYWLHYYSAEELECVLRDGTRFAHVDVRESGDSIFACAAPSRSMIPPNAD